MSLKKTFVLYIVFIAAISGSNLFGQITGSLRGFVTDSTSGEILAFGNVLIKELETGSATDANGYFYIPSIRANRVYTLIVSYVGYQTKRIKVFVIPNKINHVDIQLVPETIRLGEVEKVGEKYRETTETEVSIDRIFPRELEQLPKGVETDIFRSLQYIPGVQKTGDVSARFYVRGGSSNQNLVTLNDVTLYSPFHALGLFGVVDPDMVNFTEFYKGGFSAKYGGRLSSLMRIVTKDGNKNSYHGSVAGSFLTVKAMAEGPIPDGSFLVTGRKSHSNAVLKKFFNDQNVPVDFYDLSFKVNYSNPEFMQHAKFTVHGFYSSDFLDNADPVTEDFKWSNSIIGATYFQWVTDAPIFYRFKISTSNFEGEVIPNQSQKRSKENKIEDVTFGGDVTYIFDNNDEIYAGMQIELVNSEVNLENINGGISEISSKGGNTVVYLGYKMMHFDNFGLDAGTRVNLTRFAPRTGGQIFFEPRLSFSYSPFQFLKFKGAWGIYLQDLTTISDENEIISIFEPWIITPKYITPSTAIHYILGFEVKPDENLSFDVETYFKNYNDLTFVNERKYFPGDADLVTGEGESYGTEFSGSYKNSFLTFTASYALSWAFKEIFGMKYRPRYDARHIVNLILEADLGSGWKASTVWQYTSGLPFTQIKGYYNKLHFNDLNSRDFYFDPVAILAQRNAERLPDYHRLDINISKSFDLGIIRMILDASLINVYNRKNLFYFDNKTGKRVNMLPFLPTATLRFEI